MHQTLTYLIGHDESYAFHAGVDSYRYSNQYHKLKIYTTLHVLISVGLTMGSNICLEVAVATSPFDTHNVVFHLLDPL